MPPSSYQPPDPRNTFIGSGETWVDRYDATTLLRSYQLRHAGMVSDLQFTPSRTSVDLMNHMTGAKTTYDEATTGLGGDISMKCNEATKENIALAVAGLPVVFAQTSGTATLLAIPNSAVVKVGYALDTGKKQIVVTAVQKAGGSALGATEWSYDPESGLITVLEGATTVADGDSITWTGTYPTIASKITHGLAQPEITLAIKFRSASNAKGPRHEWNFHKVRLTVNAAIALITDAYGEITLAGKLLVDTTQPAGQQYYSVREI